MPIKMERQLNHKNISFFFFYHFSVRTTHFDYFPIIYYAQRDLCKNKKKCDTLPLKQFIFIYFFNSQDWFELFEVCQHWTSTFLMFIRVWNISTRTSCTLIYMTSFEYMISLTQLAFRRMEYRPRIRYVNFDLANSSNGKCCSSKPLVWICYL